MGLTFDVLRQANINRLPTFKNSKGELTHDATGANWTPAQWLQALTGELGEYANIRKKFERGDIDEATFKDLAGKELAGVQTYLDIFSLRLGIDLGLVTVSKFNKKSREVGSPILILDSGRSVLNETRPGQYCGDVLFIDRSINKDLHKLAEDRANRNYELRCRIMELEAEIKQLQSGDNSKENEVLKKRNASLNGIIDDFAAKIVDKDRQIETLNERIRSLNRRYDEISNDLVSSRNNNHRLSVENENIIIKNKDLQDHIHVMNMELSQLKEKLNAISKLSDQKPVIEVKVGMDQINVHKGSRHDCTNYNSASGFM